MSRCKFMGYDDRTPPIAGGYDNAEAAAGARGTLCASLTLRTQNFCLKKYFLKARKKYLEAINNERDEKAGREFPHGEERSSATRKGVPGREGRSRKALETSVVRYGKPPPPSNLRQECQHKSPNPTETGSPGRGDASRWEYETGRSRGNQEDPSSAPERSRRGVRRCHRVCPRAVTAESGRDPCVSCSPRALTLTLTLTLGRTRPGRPPRLNG